MKNRIVMPAMLTNFSLPEGLVTDQHLAYYRARAAGGAGLIIIEPSYVHPHGRIRVEQLSVCDESAIPGLKRLVETVRNEGSKAAIQLHHGGRNARSVVTGLQPVGPSTIPTPGLEVPREITAGELEEVIASFARAALIVREAGFDALEISATTGGLLGQFMSRACNDRSDRYGDGLTRRAEPLLDVLKAVRSHVGDSFPIICRFNGREDARIKNGLTARQGREIAGLVEAAGVDAAHVYVDYDGAPAPIEERPLRPGGLIELARGIKGAVNLPVIAVGRIGPLAAERLLASKGADLISMGKALIADPELPNKAEKERMDSIRPCVVCLRCIDNVRLDLALECTANPRTGHEAEESAEPTPGRSKVLIIGGGPAGLEAAKAAADRGCRVTLCERSMLLGGAMVLGVILNPDLEELRDYLIRMVRRSSARIELKTEATPELVREIKPDVIVLATGGSGPGLDVPVAGRTRVVTAQEMLGALSGRKVAENRPVDQLMWRMTSLIFRFYNPNLLRSLMRLKFPVGRKLVVIGGGFAGAELGLAYAGLGRKVTIVEESNAILSDLGPTMKAIYLAKLKKEGVELVTDAVVTELPKQGVMVNVDGTQRLIKADTVALATGLKPGRDLADELAGGGWKLHIIGDCRSPARIKEAIADGHRLGRTL